MTKRKKLWYGFLILLIITGNAVAVYAAIRDKNWLWAIAGSIALVGVTVSFGGIFIGAMIAERSEKKEYRENVLGEQSGEE